MSPLSNVKSSLHSMFILYITENEIIEVAKSRLGLHSCKYSKAIHIILYETVGFRKSHFTNHAIILLVDKFNNALDSGNVLIGVFIDIKKDCDTVNHKILVAKLFRYGVRRNILHWFKSYLSNRKQYVHLQGTYS